MNNPFSVSGVECVRNLDSQRQHRLHLQRTSDNAVLERHAIEKFHDDKRHSILLVDLMDGANIRMIQGRRGFGFALKSAQSLRIFGDIVGEEFESDEAPEFYVLGLIDHTHPAATQLLNDSVVRNDLTNHSEISRLSAAILGWKQKQVNGSATLIRCTAWQRQ